VRVTRDLFDLLFKTVEILGDLEQKNSEEHPLLAVAPLTEGYGSSK